MTQRSPVSPLYTNPSGPHGATTHHRHKPAVGIPRKSAPLSHHRQLLSVLSQRKRDEWETTASTSESEIREAPRAAGWRARALSLRRRRVGSRGRRRRRAILLHRAAVGRCPSSARSERQTPSDRARVRTCVIHTYNIGTLARTAVLLVSARCFFFLQV